MLTRRLSRLANPNVGAGALLALLVLVYLAPVLLNGKVLAASSSLYLFTPWYVEAPRDLSQHLNSLLTDIPFAVYPWNVIMRHAILSGTFPAWNSASLTGTPFFANPQTGMFAPFNLPLWVLPLNYGTSLSAALKLWFAGFGCYLLARELKLGVWPGVLAGIAYAFCGFSITWLEHESPTAVACMLPWMIWAVERTVRRRRGGDTILMAGLAAASIAGGHPGTAVQAVGGVAFYVVVRSALAGGLSRAERLRVLALSWGGLLLGGLLTSVISLPTLLAGSGTAGARARAGGGPVMPLYLLRTAVFPDWWGRSNAIEVAPVTLWNYVERTIYVGVIPLLLAVTAFLHRGDWRRKGALLALGALGLFVPLGVPLVRFVVVHLPLFDQVLDERMTFLYEFAVAMLAAFGLQYLIDLPQAQRRQWTAVILALAAALIAVVGSHPSLHDIRTTINHFRTGTSYSLSEILALTSVGWWLIFVAAFAAVLLLVRSRRFPLAALGPLLVLLVALDGLHFANGFQPMAPASTAIPASTPLIHYLQGHESEGRVTGYGGALPTDFDTVFGLQDVRGYDAPQPSEGYLRLWQAANPTQAATAPFVLPTATGASLQVMSVLGARWLVRDPRFTPAITGPGVSLAYQGSDGDVYRNANAVPRAFVPSTVVVSHDVGSSVADIASAGFAPMRSATVEAPGGSALAAAAPGGRVSVLHEAADQVELDAHLPRRGMVVLDDAFASGWSVTVDGRGAKPLKADVVMRGVSVPAGDHVIRWSYRVPGLRAGAIVSLVTLLGLIASALTLLMRRSRAPTQDEAGERPPHEP